MRKSYLDSLTSEELFYKAATDPANGKWYRDELQKRHAEGKDPLVDKIFGNSRHQPHQHQPQPQPQMLDMTDIRQYLPQPLLKENYLLVIHTIRSSGWDLIDPAGRMTSNPDDVADFLDSLLWRQLDYDDLLEKAKGKLNAIIDSYGRWWRRNNPA
jgi:hypothetical protein